MNKKNTLLAVFILITASAITKPNFPFDFDDATDNEKKQKKEMPTKPAPALLKRKPTNKQEELEEKILTLLEKIRAFADEFSQFPFSEDVKKIIETKKEEIKNKEQAATRHAKRASQARSSRWTTPSSSRSRSPWRRSDWGKNLDDWWSDWGGSDRGRDWSSNDRSSTWDRDRDYSQDRSRKDQTSTEKGVKTNEKDDDKYLSDKDKDKKIKSLYDKTITSFKNATDYIKKLADRAVKKDKNIQDTFARDMLNDRFFSGLNEKLKDIETAQNKLSEKIDTDKQVEYDKKQKNRLKIAKSELDKQYKRIFSDAVRATTLPGLDEPQKNEQHIGVTLLKDTFKDHVSDATFKKEYDKRAGELLAQITNAEDYSDNMRDIIKIKAPFDKPEPLRQITDEENDVLKSREKLQSFFSEKRKELAERSMLLFPDARQKLDAELSKIDKHLALLNQNITPYKEKREFKSRLEQLETLERDIAILRTPPRDLAPTELSSYEKINENLTELKKYFASAYTNNKKQIEKITTEIKDIDKSLSAITDETTRRPKLQELKEKRDYRKDFYATRDDLKKAQKRIQTLFNKLTPEEELITPEDDE